MTDSHNEVFFDYGRQLGQLLSVDFAEATALLFHSEQKKLAKSVLLYGAHPPISWHSLVQLLARQRVIRLVAAVPGVRLALLMGSWIDRPVTGR